VIRKFVILGSLLLLLAGCAAKPPPPRVAPIVSIPPAPPQHAPPPGFSGLSPDALRARLGAPAFLRKDGATEMWRYDAGACHAFFFFTGGSVTHIETVPRGSSDSADPVCLSALRKTS
jgi:hypothetical protein